MTGCSQYAFMFLNTFKSAEHCRSMRRMSSDLWSCIATAQTQGPELELEANAFAPAFLMPRKSVMSNAPRHHSSRVGKHSTLLEGFGRRWSMSTILTAGRDSGLGLPNVVHRLAEAGYRTKEPKAALDEKSLILEKVFKAPRDEGVSKFDVAVELLIPLEEIGALTFNLMLNLSNGSHEGSTPATEKGHGGIRLRRFQLVGGAPDPSEGLSSGVNDAAYLTCLPIRPAISNIDTCGLPKTARSLVSALIKRLFV